MMKTIRITCRMGRVPAWLAGIALLLVGGHAANVVAQSELRIAESSFVGEIVDPIDAGLGSGPFLAPAFDFLVTMSKDGKPAPGIATDWTVTNGGRDYTF